jgi:hypothetical protein
MVKALKYSYFVIFKCFYSDKMTIAGTIRTCCDLKQLEAMDEKLRLAEGVLKRCTSCVKNLMRHICEFSCSTKQSKFIDPFDLLQTPGNGNNL